MTNLVNQVYYLAMNPVPASDTASDVRHHTNRKSLVHPLAFLANDFRERIRLGLKARKHHLQSAHAKVLVHMDIHGSRLTDLAERAGISKQAMGKIIDELEKLGYVSRVGHQAAHPARPAINPKDRRAKTIQFTRKGLKLLKDSGEIVEEVWSAYASAFGEKRLEKFRDELQSLYGVIRGES